jgi:hypothetical protein
MKTGHIIDIFGDKYWLLDDVYHRENGPAIEDADGNKEWWVKGRKHRADGPAIEWMDGTKEWWVNGKRHRLDGPASEGPINYWYNNGLRHRDDGPAVEWQNGIKEWYFKGTHLKYSIPKRILLNYIKANNLTVAHLLTDLDPLVRKSASKYKWEKVK